MSLPTRRLLPPAMILLWTVSTDIPYGINDLGTGTILQCIYSIQSSEWVPEIVFRDWLSIGLAIGLTVLNAGLDNKYEYGG